MSNQKTILTIGAYERDNFGDMLFFLVLQYISQKYNIQLVASSLIESDMREYFGVHVLPYDFLLSEYYFDTVWIVGGEMGACTIPMAIEMSIQNIYLDQYQHIEEKTRNSLNEYLTGGKSDHLAYLPYMDNYKKNKHTPLIINSVGGFELLEQFANKTVVQNTIHVLQNTHTISVRSKQSHNYLLVHGIRTGLVPDSVHALPLFYQPENPVGGEYILFQISKHLFDLYGIEMVGKSLYALIQKYNCPVYLFSAGTANHHDSLELYEYIKKYMYDIYSENKIEVIYEKKPLKRVDWIAYAKICISSSLHGRIIAISYKVPRISFAIEKLDQYAETWDPLFPYGVVPSTMVDACEKALVVSMSYKESVASHLIQLAKDNIEDIVKTLYAK